MFSILEDNGSITERGQLREAGVRRKDVVSHFGNIEFKMISRNSISNSLKITEYTEGDFYVKVRLER